MKKNTLLLWVASMLMATFTACSNEEDMMGLEQEIGRTVTIRALIADHSQSRIVMGDEDEKILSWSEGDAFTLSINGKDFTFTYSSGDKFTCSDEGIGETLAAGGNVTATYPAVVPESYIRQAGTKTGLGKFLTLEAAKTLDSEMSLDNLTLEFQHKKAVVKMALNNTTFANQEVSVWFISKNFTRSSTEKLMADENGNVAAYFSVDASATAVSEASVIAMCGEKSYSATLTGSKVLVAGNLYAINKQVEEVDEASDGYVRMLINGKYTRIVYNVKGLYAWAEQTKTNRGESLILASDITLPEPEEGKGNWNTVVPNYTGYGGIIDGQGFSISNLTIVETEASNNMTGFVGYLYASKGATIKNLVMKDVNISSKSSYTGAIVGHSQVGITNCHVLSGTVVGNGNNALVGGVVGFLDSSGVLSGCTNAASVSSTGYVGGVVGQNNDTKGVVIACGNTGIIKGKNRVGGVVGSLNKGKIIGSWTLQGTVIGNSSTAVSGCFAADVAGNITAMNAAINEYNSTANSSSKCNFFWVLGSDGYPVLQEIE